MSSLNRSAVYYAIAIVQALLLWFFFDAGSNSDFLIIGWIYNLFESHIDRELYQEWFPVTIVFFLPPFLYFLKDLSFKKQFVLTAIVLAILLASHVYLINTAGSDLSYFLIIPQILCLFLLLPFFQLSKTTTLKSVTYSQYFDRTIRNGVQILQAFLFYPILVLLGFLWASLFNLIKITIFKDIFSEPLFLVVAFCCYATAAITTKVSEKYLDTLSRWLLTALSLIFVVFSVAVALFLIILPFQGLSLLWEQQIATPVLLTTQITLLALFNATYKDGSQSPYPVKLHYFLLAVIAVLPIITFINIYSIGIRISSYGITPFRLAILLAVLIAGAFSITYSILIANKKLQLYFGKANLALILLTAFISFLTLTPVLDIFRISANSQFSRLANLPAEKIEKTDLNLQRLGYYGIEALKKLKDHSNMVQYKERIEKILENPQKTRMLSIYDHEEDDISRLERIKSYPVYPVGTVLDDKTYEAIIEKWTSSHRNFKKNEAAILLMDITRDNQPEIIILSDSYLDVFWKNENNQWESIASGYQYGDNPLRLEDRNTLLQAGNFSSIEPPKPVLQNLKIGEHTLKITPSGQWGERQSRQTKAQPNATN